MSKYDLIKANLDEKNICTDWIECDIFNDDVLLSKLNNTLLGFFNNALLEVHWSSRDNYLDCLFFNTSKYKYTEEDVNQLISIVKATEAYNDGILVQYDSKENEDGEKLISFRFYFVED